MLLLLLTLACATASAVVSRAFPLEGLNPHPRLVLTDAGVAALRASIAAHPEHASIAASVAALAESYLTAPPTRYPNCTVVGACRNEAVFGPGASYLDAGGAASIITVCSLQHRLSGSTASTPFSARAIAELLHVSAFPSFYWPVGQALERAGISYGVALGYDWLWALLTPTQRATIERALGVLVLETRLRDEREGMWWLRDGLNWAINSNSPLLATALAIADVPQWASAAAQVVDIVLADVVPPVSLFAPFGIWPEGIS